MITIIICGIIGLIIAIVSIFDGFDYIEDIIMYFLFGIIGALIGGLIGFGIAFALPAKTEIVKTTYNLEALQDNNSVNGSFFLGTGQIEGEMKYVFYYEKDGYYKLEQVDYNEVKVKYSNEKPKAERFRQKNVKDAFINNFAIGGNYYQEYIIYVPKGTIKQNYSLDAQ
mgnify:CR=1 FL=1